MNDASNASALILLAVVTLAGAAVGTIFGLIRYSRLELHDHWGGAEIIELPSRSDLINCRCGMSWCPGTTDGNDKGWWKP